MAVLVDLTCLCEEHTDSALEHVFKAQGENPPDDSIWDAHPNPYIRRIVELFTQRGLNRISGLTDELKRWLAGENHKPGAERPARPEGAMARWSVTEIGLTKLYLESLPPDQFTLDDWMLVVDYLVQRYLPATDLRTESEWMATRSSLMGRVQAALSREPTEAEADHILASLPGTIGQAADAWGLKPWQRSVLEYGNAHCAENVAGLTDAIRHRLRRLVMDHTEGKFLGDRARAAGSLQTRLMDEFGTMNRDWRRIAVTEAGENLNQGLISTLPPGRRVKRVEKYRGACPFCRSIDGTILTVAAPDDPAKNGAKQVWVGKTNIGRAAAPKKRKGGELVDREAHERWWIPAGTVHPNCRGGWVVLEDPQRKADPKFSAWMDEVLGRAPS